MEDRTAKITAAVKAKVVDNRLTCAQAHEIEQELKVTLGEIGKVADDLGIKIAKCQLGCF